MLAVSPEATPSELLPFLALTPELTFDLFRPPPAADVVSFPLLDTKSEGSIKYK
jgi:hypothetical protein